MRKSSWSPPSDISPQELLVVASSSHFFDPGFVQDIELPEEWGLDITCRFSSDRSLMQEANALWFHGPSIRTLPEKLPQQKWIVMSMESAVNYPFLKEKQAMALFDIHMTYLLDSDVPVAYPNWTEYGGFMQEPAPLHIKNDMNSIALYVASNPISYRDDYVSELMEYINVDSVGKCLNNKTIAGISRGTEGQGESRYPDLTSLIRNYKFYLAFENSCSRDYVTEKVFMALNAGAVPVYCGAENIHEFMPDDDAVIHIDRFNSPKELADYLLYLDQNDDEYMKHLAWKSSGYNNRFKNLVDASSIHSLHRMFVKLAHGCGHECNCGGRLR